MAFDEQRTIQADTITLLIWYYMCIYYWLRSCTKLYLKTILKKPKHQNKQSESLQLSNKYHSRLIASCQLPNISVHLLDYWLVITFVVTNTRSPINHHLSLRKAWQLLLFSFGQTAVFWPFFSESLEMLKNTVFLARSNVSWLKHEKPSFCIQAEASKTV